MKARFLLPLGALLLPQLAGAETPRVLVVVESDQSSQAGDAVRGDLASLGAATIVSPHQPGVESAPDVVITTASAEGRVSVRYWDRSGQTDALSTSLPINQASFQAVASTLASVLLQKNLPAYEMSRSPAPVIATAWDQPLENWRPHHPQTGVAQRRTYALTIDEF